MYASAPTLLDITELVAMSSCQVVRFPSWTCDRGHRELHSYRGRPSHVEVLFLPLLEFWKRSCVTSMQKRCKKLGQIAKTTTKGCVRTRKTRSRIVSFVPTRSKTVTNVQTFPVSIHFTLPVSCSGFRGATSVLCVETRLQQMILNTNRIDPKITAKAIVGSIHKNVRADERQLESTISVIFRYTYRLLCSIHPSENAHYVV